MGAVDTRSGSIRLEGRELRGDRRHNVANAGLQLVPEERRAVALAAEGAPARFCPRCGSPSLVKLEGCESCVSCGYSQCG